jgi:hypothetical protein
MKTAEITYLIDAKINICQLKLKEAKLVKEKQEVIWRQDYQKAAIQRDKDRVIQQELQQMYSEVSEFISMLPKESLSVEVLLLCENTLAEFTFQESDRLNARDAFLSHFADEFDELSKLRDQLMKEQRFKEANELLEQRIMIGKFLSSVK